MDEAVKEKKIYREWIEYLKLSDNYSDFCKIIEKKKQSPSLIIPFKFKSLNYPANYFIFGHVRSPKWNFDEWWSNRKHKISLLKGLPVVSYISRKILKITDDPQITRIVEDLSDVFNQSFDSCISTFKFYNNQKEPTLKEFKSYFIKQLKEGDSLYQDIILRIDPRGEKIETILQEVKKIIKKNRQLDKVKTKELHAKLFLKPTTRYIRFDELEKYRQTYKLRIKKISPQHIITTVNPKDDPTNLDVQRTYRDFYSKAKKIITNVEAGMFPGAYDETTSRRKKRNAKNL